MKIMIGSKRNLKISGKIEFTKNIPIIISIENDIKKINSNQIVLRIEQALKTKMDGMDSFGIIFDEVTWED